ncbi:MAG: hypothetical protein LH606_17085 [Cytophagaceae bacterium]|nr:hypothetical protein [Cytophagaceae bacterium]
MQTLLPPRLSGFDKKGIPGQSMPVCFAGHGQRFRFRTTRGQPVPPDLNWDVQ